VFVVLQWIQWIILMEEGRGARKEVDLRCQLGGSPPKLDFGQGRNRSEEILSSCHDDLYGRAVLLMHSCWEWRRSFYQYCVAPGNPLFLVKKVAEWAFSSWFFFRYAAPWARSATHERSENKARGNSSLGEILLLRIEYRSMSFLFH